MHVVLYYNGPLGGDISYKTSLTVKTLKKTSCLFKYKQLGCLRHFTLNYIKCLILYNL